MGPLYVRTPEPGNVLLVEILAMEMDSWGWTADFHVRITGRRDLAQPPRAAVSVYRNHGETIPLHT